MRHVSGTHRVALDWIFDRKNLDPKVQIKYIDTKKPTRRHTDQGKLFTRDEWNHLLCLFNISHSSSSDCSEVFSKRTQKDSGEERVTAKSQPMMNLVSRCSEKTHDVLAFTASETLGETRYESQLSLSSWNEQSSYSEWNVDTTLFYTEWKFDELMEIKTRRLVVFAQNTDRFFVENDNVDFYNEAESEMSFKSRSFLQGRMIKGQRCRATSQKMQHKTATNTL